MLSDGSTFIERIERVEESTTLKTKNDNDNIVNPQSRHFNQYFI